MFRIEIAKLILDFIATLITSWPFVILVIIVFFHKEIGDNITKIFDLFTRLKSLQAGDKSIIFSEQLAKIEHENEDPSQEITMLELKPDWEFTPLDEFDKLAIIRPDFAILDSWRPIEKRLSLITQHESDNVKSLSPISNLKYLIKKQLISENHYLYIREIMKLRNAVVHYEVKSITYEDAYTYRKSCIEIMQILETIPHIQ